MIREMEDCPKGMGSKVEGSVGGDVQLWKQGLEMLYASTALKKGRHYVLQTHTKKGNKGWVEREKEGKGMKKEIKMSYAHVTTSHNEYKYYILYPCTKTKFSLKKVYCICQINH